MRGSPDSTLDTEVHRYQITVRVIKIDRVSIKALHGVGLIGPGIELAGQHLTPAPGRRAEVHHPIHPREEVVLVVDLHQLEGRPSAEADLLGFTVEYILSGEDKSVSCLRRYIH